MHPMPLPPRTRPTSLEGVRVADLMTPSPVSVRHRATVREAALFLTSWRIGAAPVVNDAGRAVGVLSRFDVLSAVRAGLAGAPVREVMTPSVVTVRPQAPPLDASDHLIRHAVRRVFVVDDGGAPTGVLSATDLCRGLAAGWPVPGGHAVPSRTKEFTS